MKDLAPPAIWHIDLDLPSIADSEQFAQQLAPCLDAPLVMTLSGDIGTGKTTIVRALLRAIGVRCRIKSPTFSLIETYDLPTAQFHHFDLYRIVDESELEFLGFRDYFQTDTLCCLEWPEKIHLPDDRVDLALSIKRSGEGRMLKMVVRGRMRDVIQKKFRSHS